MTINEALESFGLNPKESKTYLAVMELGTSPVRGLTKKTGIERTNLYSILAKLENEKLITSFNKKGVKYFVADSPEKLTLRLKEKEEKISEVLPELKSIYNISPHKPKVLYFEGKEGMRAISDRSLEKAELSDKIVLFATSMDYYHESVTVEYENDYYVPTRLEKGVKLKALVTHGKWINERHKLDEREDRETKFLPKKWAFKSTTFIYADEVAFISTAKEGFGIVIQSKEINDMMRKFYDMAWQVAERD